VDVAAHQRELDELAQRVRQRIAPRNETHKGRMIVETINQVLFAEEGFYGNLNAYYEPDNSYLNRVLERRTGIPVTLSLVFLLLARRLHLPIRGINMPVHFICQYHTPRESFYFDPFNNGRIMTRAECAMLLLEAGHTFDDDCLRPASSRTIIARMIRNLVLIYEHQGQAEKASRLDRVLKMLRMNG
jgi:regulator of sirC expression with transglutaminase-like and TPR domain